MQVDYWVNFCKPTEMPKNSKEKVPLEFVG